MFKITARDQGHYKGFRGHLLHTVTFLVKAVFGSSILYVSSVSAAKADI